MSTRPPIQAILFDLYDTLVCPDWTALYGRRAELAARVGVDPDTLAAEWRRTTYARSLGQMGSSLDQEIIQLVAGCGRALDSALARELAELELDNWRRGVSLYADTVPHLRALRDRGYRLAIVSNCSSQAGALVEHLGLRGLVNAVVLSWEAGVMKPDPRFLNLALSQLGTSASQALLVDDVAANLDAARGLGLATAYMVRPGGPPAEPSDHPGVSSLDDLWLLLDTGGRPA